MAVCAVRCAAASVKQPLNSLLMNKSLIYIPIATVKKAAAASKAALQLSTAQRQRLEPETDPYKLTQYLCGGNIYIDGEDPKLGPDEDYPDWLWELPTETVPFEELDPDTWAYWHRLRRMNRRRIGKLKSIRYKYKLF